jgi:YD repeat-containing protein
MGNGMSERLALGEVPNVVHSGDWVSPKMGSTAAQRMIGRSVGVECRSVTGTIFLFLLCFFGFVSSSWGANYSYDALGRLTSVDYESGMSAIYQYDPAGNRTRVVEIDPLRYIASYPDLIQAFGANATYGKQHYINNGIAEGRNPTLFDPLAYIASYGDLIEAFGDNAVWGETHYIANGYSEGRKTTFDAVAYLINNSDLGSAGFLAKDVTRHYIKNGYWEHRTTAGAFGTEQTNHSIAIGGSVSDTIGTSGDKDWFSLSVVQGQTYTFRLSGIDGGGGTLADPYLAVYNPRGVILTYNDNASNRDSLITFLAIETGTIYLVVSANGSGTGTYRLSVVAG